MTQDTEALIDSLVHGVKPVRPMPSPVRLLSLLAVMLAVYAAGTACFTGLRPDLVSQLHRPFYLAEISLLIVLIASSVTGAVYMAFPDQYQHPSATKLPFCCFGAFIALLSVQSFLPADPRMVIPSSLEANRMVCTVCIGLISMIPSALMFVFLRAGASAHPPLSGAYVVLAAAGIGCLVIRLEEANDSLLHLALWHYLPALAFAMLGAFIGKYFLKW